MKLGLYMVFHKATKAMKQSDDKGFTIVELMLAMTIFSLVLVAAAAGLIQVGRMYYKSVITTRTQDVARSAIDEISRSIQFSGAIPQFTPESSSVDAVCIGSNRYSFQIDNQVSGDNDSSSYALYKDEAPPGCDDTPPQDGVELLGDNMRLTRFEVRLLPGSVDQYRVILWTAYGDDDVLDVDPENSERTICATRNIGGEFCAISELSTVVSKRLL